MPPFLLSNASVIAASAVTIVLFLGVGLSLGLGATEMAVAGLSALAMVLSGLVLLLNHRLRTRETHMRQSLSVVERLQAMTATAPYSYCLFTIQGLLRESVRMNTVLDIEKATHIDDIVAAIRDASDFMAAFRKLQQTGTAFTLVVEAIKNRKLIQVTGRRFRIGREGPLFDALWFSDASMSRAWTDQSNVPSPPASAIDPTRDGRFLCEALPFPVWQRDTDLRLIMCNSVYANAVDTTPDKVIAEQHELASPTTRGGEPRLLATHALASGQVRNERRHVVIGGKRRLLEIAEVPLKNDAGVLLGLLGFARDVTAEEDKDTELQRHLTAQNEVLEHLGSAIAIYGADTRLEFYNRAYQRLWEGGEAFLNGKPTFGEILEDLRTRRRAPEQADFQRYKKERIALFTSLLEPREDLMHLPDGTSLRILAVPHPFGGIMFVHEDVTDKLALESSYNTLIAVQRETLDNLAEGIAVFGPDGRVRLSNPSFARIWGLQEDFLATGPHVSDLLEHMKPLFNFGSTWSAFKNEMVEYTLDRHPHKGRLIRADQSAIDYSTTPLPDGAVLNSYLDVSDSIKAEQALRASNAALETADRLKSEFVANVSYQLRTPLNTIMGFAEILTNQYFGALNERQLEYARTIMEASKRLLLLINDVLDLATIEAGRMALHYGVVNVADLLNGVKQMVAEWGRQQALDILVDCPSNLGTFDGDEQRLKQVLFNLVSNAIKYTPEGGRVTLQGRRADAWVILSVTDTGIGIAESDRERVFGKFERSNTHMRQTGAGLGLSLVKNFIELHGGRIEIVANTPVGTRIDCYLPVKAPTGTAIRAS